MEFPNCLEPLNIELFVILIPVVGETSGKYILFYDIQEPRV